MIYSITNFSPKSYPHWDTALIEADNEQEARAALVAALIRHNSEEESIETLWSDVEIDQSKWLVSAAEKPLRFILGGACR
jgi:3-methyladenine DNA glycosylase AlkD